MPSDTHPSSGHLDLPFDPNNNNNNNKRSQAEIMDGPRPPNLDVLLRITNGVDELSVKMSRGDKLERIMVNFGMWQSPFTMPEGFDQRMYYCNGRRVWSTDTPDTVRQQIMDRLSQVTPNGKLTQLDIATSWLLRDHQGP